MILIVTGGSRGIGAAICTLAADRGFDVVINYSASASSEDDVRTLFDAAGELGPLAGLVMSTRYGDSGGEIVNISSTAASRGSAGEWVHYAASKAAVETLTIGLAHEVAREGVRSAAAAELSTRV